MVLEKGELTLSSNEVSLLGSYMRIGFSPKDALKELLNMRGANIEEVYTILTTWEQIKDKKTLEIVSKVITDCMNKSKKGEEKMKKEIKPNKSMIVNCKHCGVPQEITAEHTTVMCNVCYKISDYHDLKDEITTENPVDLYEIFSKYSYGEIKEKFKKAKTDDEQDFYICLANYILQRDQKKFLKDEMRKGI